MSSRYLQLLPLLAAAILACSGQSARSATQTTPITSVTSGSFNSSFTNFEITPVANDLVASGAPIDVYFKGELNAAMRCKNVDGCGALTLALSASFNYYSPAGGGLLSTPFYPVTYVTYGPTDYGDYLDFKPVKLASDPITVSYDSAKYLGLITDPAFPAVHPYGTLSTYSGYVLAMDGDSWQHYYQDFDHFNYGLLNPTFNIHYYSAPVPEPSAYMLLAAGLVAASLVTRRKSAR